MRASCLAIVLAFTSCGGEPEPAHPPSTTTEVREATPPTTAAIAPSTVPSAPESARVAPSAPPSLAFVATPGADGVAMSIANHGASSVSLRASVIVEVESNGTFAAAPSTSSLTLRYDCAHEASECVDLAPGAELLPPSWLGTWGDMQCVCTRCGPVEAGSYRLVVTTCDGAHRVESNAFALPAP